MNTPPRRAIRILAIAAVAAATLVTTTAVVVPAAADAQPTPTTGQGLTGIRTGGHATYDRIVLDFRGPVPPTPRATWVGHLTADPSGKRVALPGNAFLDVAVHGTSTRDVDGHRTYFGKASLTTPALRNVRAVAITGDFERVLTIGVGARHRGWVHVFTLTRPSRLVIDVGR